MIKFIIGFFGWLAFIHLEVNRNYKIIEKLNEKPDYLNSLFVRSFFALICLFLMVQSFDPAILLTWLEAWPAIVFELTSFYLVFDPYLNLKRGKPFSYRGKSSGWIDPVLSTTMWWTLKGVSLIGLVVSIIRLWQRN